MLTITFQNDGTGNQQIGNYDVRVELNGTVYDEARVEGHERERGWRGLLGELVYTYRQSELEQALNTLFQGAGPLCVDAVDGVKMLQRLTDAQQADLTRYKNWVHDLQAGMYVNCVYCGHRYGPEDEVPTTMAQALKEHIEQCPEHPMSKLKERLEEVEARNDLFNRCMDRAQVLWREAHPEKPCMWPDGAENICWLLEELDKARAPAAEEYRRFMCPKCGAEFEDPDPENEFSSGILCPECTGDVKGVIHPRWIKRIITQDDWDRLQEALVALLSVGCPAVPLEGKSIEELLALVPAAIENAKADSHYIARKMALMNLEATLGTDRVVPREDIPLPSMEHFVVSGKLGPWARNGGQGHRYVTMGVQGHEEHIQIEHAEKDGDTWRYIRVTTKTGETLLLGCGTNIYQRVRLSDDL